MCRDNDEMESSCCRRCRYVSCVSFFADAKIKTLGLKPANNMQSVMTELKNDCACVTFDPVGQSSFEIAQSARHLARKYRLEQHMPNETLDFAAKFRLVFRYETVVSRRYVLALLLVGLLRKFEAYLVYLTLIWR